MPQAAGPWVVTARLERDADNHTYVTSVNLVYTGQLGANSFNFAPQEISDLRHVIDQSVKECIRHMPAERRLEI